MRKNRICFFTNSYAFSRQKLMESYEAMLSETSEIFLFCRKEDFDKFKLKKVKKVGYSSNYLLIFSELRRFCRENNIDILVGFSGGNEVSFLITLAMMGTKTKYIAHTHGNFFWHISDIHDLPFFGYTLRFNLKHLFFFLSQFFMFCFMTCAEDITEKMKRYFFLSKNKIEYVPSIVDTDFFIHESRQKARRILKIGKNEKVAVYTGRVEYFKGSDMLLKLIKKNPSVKFILVGDIADKNYKKDELNNVVFAGVIKDQKKLIDYYNAADLCVFFSRSEGNPYVSREAMSCGTPVMVADIESVRLYKPAIKVQFNIEDIQKKFEEFFKLTEKEREKLGKESRDFVVKEYSYHVWKERYQKYFSISDSE